MLNAKETNKAETYYEVEILSNWRSVKLAGMTQFFQFCFKSLEEKRWWKKATIYSVILQNHKQ